MYVYINNMFNTNIFICFDIIKRSKFVVEVDLKKSQAIDIFSPITNDAFFNANWRGYTEKLEIKDKHVFVKSIFTNL